MFLIHLLIIFINNKGNMHIKLRTKDANPWAFSNIKIPIINRDINIIYLYINFILHLTKIPFIGQFKQSPRKRVNTSGGKCAVLTHKLILCSRLPTLKTKSSQGRTLHQP